MNEKNKYVKGVIEHPGYDALTGESPVFEMFKAEYSNSFPAVKAGATNGHSFLRHNSPLCQAFVVRKIYADGSVEEINNGRWSRVAMLAKEKSIKVPVDVKGRALIGWWTRALAPKSEMRKSPIPQDVRKNLSGQRCVFSGMASTDIDHKYGREDQDNYPETPLEEHFQPVSRNENHRKREECRRCKETGKRFDARNIPGHTKAFYEGGEKFLPHKEGCVGCYLFDPVAYRKAMMK